MEDVVSFENRLMGVGFRDRLRRSKMNETLFSMVSNDGALVGSCDLSVVVSNFLFLASVKYAQATGQLRAGHARRPWAWLPFPSR